MNDVSTVLYKISDYKVIFVQPDDVGFDIVYSSALLPEEDKSLYASMLVTGKWLTPEFTKNYVITSPTTIQEIPNLEYVYLEQFAMVKNVLQLRWQAIAGATQYKTYKSTDGENYTYASFTYDILSHNPLTANGTYFFKVSVIINGNEYFSKPISYTATRITIDRPLVNSMLIQNEGQTIAKNVITWNNTISADNAEIERVNKTTSEVNYLVTSEIGRYEDIGIEVDKAYDYRVRYTDSISGQKSNWSESTTVEPILTNYTLKQPSGLVATQYFSTVTLRCNVATDNFRGGYQWRYSENTNSNPDTATTLTGIYNNNSFQGVLGKTYNIWVRTYANLNGVLKYSSWATTSIALSKDIKNVNNNVILDLESNKTYTLKDAAGYIYTDNIGFNGKLIKAGYIDEGSRTVTIGTYSLSSSKILICRITPMSIYNILFTSNTNKTIKSVWFQQRIFAEFHENGQFRATNVLDISNTYSNLQVLFTAVVEQQCGYTDGTTETKNTDLRFYYEIFEYNVTP